MCVLSGSPANAREAGAGGRGAQASSRGLRLTRPISFGARSRLVGVFSALRPPRPHRTPGVLRCVSEISGFSRGPKADSVSVPAGPVLSASVPIPVRPGEAGAPSGGRRQMSSSQGCRKGNVYAERPGARDIPADPLSIMLQPSRRDPSARRPAGDRRATCPLGRAQPVTREGTLFQVQESPSRPQFPPGAGTAGRAAAGGGGAAKGPPGSISRAAPRPHPPLPAALNSGRRAKSGASWRYGRRAGEASLRGPTRSIGRARPRPRPPRPAPSCGAERGRPVGAAEAGRLKRSAGSQAAAREPEDSGARVAAMG